MAINMDVLGPQGDQELEIFAIEALVFQVQLELQKAIKDGNMNFGQLAEKLDMTPARVSQIFSTKGSNLTLKTIARIAFAAGVEMSFSKRAAPQARNAAASAGNDPIKRLMNAAADKGRRSSWQEIRPHNDNVVPFAVAA
jgi:transcriptional regulator with XRE-family HTH domain